MLRKDDGLGLERVFDALQQGLEMLEIAELTDRINLAMGPSDRCATALHQTHHRGRPLLRDGQKTGQKRRVPARCGPQYHARSQGSSPTARDRNFCRGGDAYREMSATSVGPARHGWQPRAG